MPSGRVFLLEYDKAAGELIRIVDFDESDRASAIQARIELELELHFKGIAREVVLLEADTEAILRLSHSRYFGNVGQLTDAAGGTVRDASGDGASSSDKLTVAKLASSRNLAVKDVMEMLIKKGYLESRAGKHYLTKSGEAVGGEVRLRNRLGANFLWPADIAL